LPVGALRDAAGVFFWGWAMTRTKQGILAMIAACVLWGLSPLFYKALSHAPPLEVLSHRTLWSVVFFGLVLLMQGRL